MNTESLLPDVHDGLLMGVFGRGDTVDMYVQSLSGEKFTISLLGLHRFHLSDFYEGNIILDCQVFEDSTPANEALEFLLRGEPADVGIPRLRKLLEDGTHQILYLTSSYGATVVALAQEISVNPLFETPTV